MGTFSQPLAAAFADLVGVEPRQLAMDVGCGPGALTSVLVDRLGLDAVSAIDPSPSFVAVVRDRFPGLDVRQGVAEHLPWPDGGFDVTLAQLVVHFMRNPVAGLAEMARVTRRGGRVAASVWDHAGGTGPVSTFWRAVAELDPGVRDDLAGAREGHLGELCRAAGLDQLQETALTVTVVFRSFDEWWEPYTLGVGPAGAYVAGLDPDRRDALRRRCAALLPSAPIEIAARAWCVLARA